MENFTKFEHFPSGIVRPDKQLWAQTRQNLNISNPELWPRQEVVGRDGTKLEHFQSGIVCSDKKLWAYTIQNLNISNPELIAQTRSCRPRRDKT